MATRLRKYGLFINGKEVRAKGNKTYIRENPATEQPLAEIAEARREDVDKAVKAASKAFETWSKLPVSERVKYIHKIVQVLEKNREKIALTNTLETGKPIRESRLVELGGSIKTLEYYAGISNQLNGESINVSESQISMTLREPIGVVGHIIPWNPLAPGF